MPEFEVTCMLTFVDAFHLVAWTCVATLLLTAVLRRPPLNFGDLGIAPHGFYCGAGEHIMNIPNALAS
jgi:hypothetical protein